MFSGIIEVVGTVGRITRQDEKARMRVDTDASFTDFELGESISVNGVCLTVVEAQGDSFSVDMTTETLNRTSFKQVGENSRVNLEKALTPSKKISGHFVTGHVDHVAHIVDIQHKTGEVLFRFEHAEAQSPYIIEKGSIAVDGISLTVFDCVDRKFTVSIIPFTLEHTNLGDRKVGDSVNIECDMIGKYVVKACETLLGGAGGEKSAITMDFLKQHGIV